MSDAERYTLLREYKATTDVRGFLARHGAHSVGIGRKIVNGEVTPRLALRVYVTKKIPAAGITPHERVPKTITFLPGHAQQRRRLYTDVIETPPARFEQIDPKTNVRPVPGGVSCGTMGHTGTMGGWVWDTTDDTIVMLSNEHVYGTAPGVDIIQRGSYDGGSTPADKIGDVKRGIPRSTTATNYVDCAIGDPDSSDIYDLRVLEIGPAVYATETPVDDMLVEKFGRTTEHTLGQITDNDWEGYVDGVYYFEDCFRVDPISPTTDWSAGGDSGSLVFARAPIAEDSDIKPVVGLHFAGGGTHGIECKIQNVFSRLELTTLCDGAFSSVADSLFEPALGDLEAESLFAALSTLASRTASWFSPLSFVRRERATSRVQSPFSGISRDLQQRLMTSDQGRIITGFVSENRAELLTLFAKDGDVRRATLAAIRPLVSGSVTTTDVLERYVTASDIKRLEKLGSELSRKGGPRLQQGLEALQALRPEAAGESLASTLKIEL